MDVRAVKAAGDERLPGAGRQWPVHPGNADLPLPRPFDVGPRKVPDRAKRSIRSAHDPDPIEQVRNRLLATG